MGDDKYQRIPIWRTPTYKKIRHILAETNEQQAEMIDRIVSAEWKRIQSELHQGESHAVYCKDERQ